MAMPSSSQRSLSPKFLAIVVLVLLLSSSGAFGFSKKTISDANTKNVTEEYTSSYTLVNRVTVALSNDAGRTTHNVATATSTVLIPVTQIPTLSPAGAIALVLFLAGFAWYLSRRRSASP